MNHWLNHKNYKIGDVVIHLATGRRMTVCRIDGDYVRCQWFLKYLLKKTMHNKKEIKKVGINV